MMRQQGADQLQASARASLAMAAIARITGVSDDWEPIEAAANQVLSSKSCNPRVALDANCGLALLAVQRDDGTAAEKLCIELEGQRGTMAWTVSSIDRVLGLLFQTLGDLDQSVNHFEDSLSLCRKAGYRPELAWSCHDYAQTLLKRNQPGDWENAASLLEEALSISTELGMRPLMERVLVLQESHESQPARSPAYPDGLTNREVEVLRLIASGKTDREIAEELLISVMTVSTHVRNLLNKTNVANRTEAATYAARHGLV
jgi:DNA-binding CsgD family transcriptional regulator